MIGVAIVAQLALVVLVIRAYFLIGKIEERMFYMQMRLQDMEDRYAAV